MDYEETLINRISWQTPSVIEEKKTWSYREFVLHVFVIRDHLIDNSIQQVAFCLPQGFYAYAVEWAAYLAGSVFCPINTSDPLVRKSNILDALQPDLLIESNCDNRYFGNVRCIDIKDLFSNVDVDNYRIKKKQRIRNTRAYVIFTSGSTGKPKGVIIKRKGLNNFLEWSVKAFCPTQADRWGQYSQMGFDLSICDIFTAIIGGSALVPFSDMGQKILPGLKINEDKITIWHSVPSVLDIMSKAGHLRNDMLSTIRIFSFCGEKLFASQLDKLFFDNQSLIVFNTYGPTEGTIFCTYIELNYKNYRDHCINTASIGEPIPGYKLEISCSDNNKGELIIASEFIGEGYLNEFNQSTNSGFQMKNIEEWPVEVFITGDYVIIHNDEMYFDTRKDGQIKLLGNRIDLSEIDEELRQLGCHQVKSVFYQNRIISFIVEDGVDNEELKEGLSRVLPSYYLPSEIVSIKEFPFNVNGKVDVKMLMNMCAVHKENC